MVPNTKVVAAQSTCWSRLCAWAAPAPRPVTIATNAMKRRGIMLFSCSISGVGRRRPGLPSWQEPCGDHVRAGLRCRPGQRSAGDLPQPVIAPGQLTAEIGRTVSLGLQQPLFVLELEMTGSVGTARLCQENP